MILHPKLTIEQYEKITHMLGLHYKKKEYRNYYCSGDKIDDDLEELLYFEIIERYDRSNELGGYLYRLTEKGKKHYYYYRDILSTK